MYPGACSVGPKYIHSSVEDTIIHMITLVPTAMSTRIKHIPVSPEHAPSSRESVGKPAPGVNGA